MNDCKELRIEAETFDKLRRDADIVLQRAFGTMKEKESMEGKLRLRLILSWFRNLFRTLTRRCRERQEKSSNRSSTTRSRQQSISRMRKRAASTRKWRWYGMKISRNMF